MDEGISSLQGLTKGMDTERIIQREAAIVSVYYAFDFTNVATKEGKLAFSFVGNEFNWIGVTCEPGGAIRVLSFLSYHHVVSSQQMTLDTAVT